MVVRESEGYLSDLIKAQERAAADPASAPLERVSARVERACGFTNSGIGASGHSVAVDEPAEFGGGGQAVDPAELLLIAVGASLSVTLTVHAALQDVVLAGISVALSGTLDAARFYRPSAVPGGGFFDFCIEIAIDSTASRAVIERLVETAIKASPVLRSIAAKPTIHLTVKDLDA